MSQKFNKTESFKALNEEWKQKLKDSGFEDAESDSGNLIRTSSEFTKKKFLKNYEAKKEYYYMATHFLNDYRFDTKIDKVVWTYHVEGLGKREISQLLKSLKLADIGPTSVYNILKTLKRAMYITYKGYST